MKRMTLLVATGAIVASVAYAMPDVMSEIQRGKCDAGPGGAGADEHYIGRFTIEDDAVKGSEKRLLFANAKWKAVTGRDNRAGEDCEVFWDVAGGKVPVSGCTHCDFGVKFQADVDFDKSTCPMDLMLKSRHWQGQYDVDVKDDGTLQLHFATSGKKLGEGYYEGNTYTYRTPHRCVWF